MTADHATITYLLRKYGAEGRAMKCCEPRDLLNRVADICSFEGSALQLSPTLIDAAWANYFGTAHGFEQYSETWRTQSQAVSA